MAPGGIEMQKFGWTRWLSNTTDRGQYDALNEQSDAIDSVNELQRYTGERVRKLYELDQEQGRELDRLRATINVLVQMLAASGALDEKAFGYRMEAALAELEPEVPAGPVISQADPAMTCNGCNGEFPMSTFTVMPNGNFCQKCARSNG
jgi:hypothetical protein